MDKSAMIKFLVQDCINKGFNTINSVHEALGRRYNKNLIRTHYTAIQKANKNKQALKESKDMVTSKPKPQPKSPQSENYGSVERVPETKAEKLQIKKDLLGDRLRYDAVQGYILDGKRITVQQLVKMDVS